LGAQLLSFQEICQTVSEEFNKCRPEKRRNLYSLIERAIGSAEELVKTLRVDR
jgi:hypothetical protein